MVRDVDDELATIVAVRRRVPDVIGPVGPAVERSWRPEGLLLALCGALFMLTMQLGEREHQLARLEARPLRPSATELSEQSGVVVRKTMTQNP